MSVTPIFEQLCRELAEASEPEVSAEATEAGQHAVAGPEPEPVPSPEQTAAEWFAPKECVA